MQMNKVLTGLVLFAFGAVAVADDPPVPAAPPVATVTKVPGQAFKMALADGREASLKVFSLDSPMVPTNIKVIDNTCTDWQGMTCQYKMKFRRFWIDLVWSKNPDASRVGQIVEYKSNGQDDKSFQKAESVNGLQTGLYAGDKIPKISDGAPAYSERLPLNELSCDDYRWLPGAPTEAPDTLHTSRWDSEDNIKNAETGVMENRTEGGAYGVDLKKIDAKTLQITRINSFTGILRTFPVLILGANQSLTLTKPSGDICQVGLSANFQGDLTVTYNGLEQKRQDLKVDLKTLPDYVYGSDELLDMSFVKFEVGTWFFDGMVYR